MITQFLDLCKQTRGARVLSPATLIDREVVSRFLCWSARCVRTPSVRRSLGWGRGSVPPYRQTAPRSGENSRRGQVRGNLRRNHVTVFNVSHWSCRPHWGSLMGGFFERHLGSRRDVGCGGCRSPATALVRHVNARSGGGRRRREEKAQRRAADGAVKGPKRRAGDGRSAKSAGFRCRVRPAACSSSSPGPALVRAAHHISHLGASCANTVSHHARCLNLGPRCYCRRVTTAVSRRAPALRS
ncbi:hypothetical protein HPB50_002047 [Hyalomma asiaticum]|uniref:Uncharacterized protein n=1 Tax=Hyalomma asiaticum TaxID=266040 RepID=A0ACB7TCW5_HYAAI|nr:hypothetical protein HPB50_002047 [Hyalomma asiaticum]